MLFNGFGYHFLFIFCEQQADHKLVSRLDKQEYSDNQLVAIRVPVIHFPYYNNSIGYERIDGQLEIDGMSYNFVKWRIYHDSIEFLCISNPQRTRLHREKIECLKSVSDIQQTEQSEKAGNHAAGSRIFLSEFESSAGYSCSFHFVPPARQYRELLLIPTENRYSLLPDIPPEFN
jgi:hypothetical protein